MNRPEQNHQRKRQQQKRQAFFHHHRPTQARNPFVPPVAGPYLIRPFSL
jgi:hypothetical protein